MNQTASICKSLLNGETLSIMDGFHKFNCTNIPREIGRIGRMFNWVISKERINFISEYGHSGVYFRYHFDKDNPENIIASELMNKYINKHKEQHERKKKA